MNYMCNDASKALEMRSDLLSNGVGDQVDQSVADSEAARVQIDGSASGWRGVCVCVFV